jgi:hypothetical protein
MFFENECWLVRKPTVLTRNDRGQLHNEAGMCISWSDGKGLYAINGVTVTEKIVMTPEKLTKKDWLNESNTEVRRIIQECMGERFVKAIGAKTIDKGTKAELVEVELPNDPDKVARYIHVKDPSTARKYYLRVPPTIDKADEAWCWTLGLEVGDLTKLQQET